MLALREVDGSAVQDRAAVALADVSSA